MVRHDDPPRLVIIPERKDIPIGAPSVVTPQPLMCEQTAVGASLLKTL